MSADDDAYDVYISYSRADATWATRLARDLGERGLRSFSDLNVSAGDSWAEALNRVLDRVGTLVVLWSPAARGSEGIVAEIARFEALASDKVQRRLVPVILGGSQVLAGVPRSLSDRQAVIISEEAVAAGPDAESEEWAAAIAAIEDAATRVPAPATKSAAPQPLPAFSTAALEALTDAMMMAPVDGSDDPAQLRTAALLGALRTSAARNMTPTTGDVVRLVLERQAAGRGPEETFAAAAAAAGLRPLSKRPPSASNLDELARTTVGELVSEAAELQRRTGSDSVHLRHILALGVHPAVPAAALRELRVTLAEIRSAWRASIARTWPDESRTGWDAILRDRGTAPPSARVHADRWTTEDRLDYALYARAIAEFIRHEDAEPPMVISVQAPWGQGKTSLMRMVQRDLDPGHPDLSSQRRKAARREDEPPSALTYGELHESLDGTLKVK